MILPVFLVSTLDTIRTSLSEETFMIIGAKRNKKISSRSLVIHMWCFWRHSTVYCLLTSVCSLLFTASSKLLVEPNF